MAGLILEIVEGAGAGRQTPLDSVVEIGRDPGLPIHLDADTQVSRHHARVTAQGDVAIVEDLGSTNGTTVNDQHVQGPRVVRPGDRIRVGLTVLELRSQAQVAHRPSAVQARPQITAIDNQVLAPVPEQELAPVGPPPQVAAPQPPQYQPAPQAPQHQPAPAGIRAQPTPAAYVPPEVVGDPAAESDYEAIARLVDTRVKQQRNVAMFAMLAIAALAVIIYFGLT